jgi:hypothetical protein
MISTVTNVFAFFLRIWIPSFHLEDSITSPNTVVPAAPRLQPDSQPGSPVSLEAHPRSDDRIFPEGLFPNWAIRCFKWMVPISPNVTIAADPRLLLPVSLPGSSTDTHNHRVSLEQDPTGYQTHTSVAGNLHYDHLKVQVDRQQSNEPDVNSLKQRLVVTSLARDSLRIKNNLLKKSSVSKQQKLDREVKDLKLSHNELVSKLNEYQKKNEILGHQHAQMEQTLHLNISELEDSCLRQKILGQKCVSASLARDSLRVKNNLLKKSSIRMQKKNQKEMDYLNRSHQELVAELNQAKLENELLSHKQAQMQRDNEIQISELEEKCLRLTKEKEDLAVKLIQS